MLVGNSRLLSELKKIYDRRVVLLVGLANASFCRLFGGDAHAMAVFCYRRLPVTTFVANSLCVIPICGWCLYSARLYRRYWQPGQRFRPWQHTRDSSGNERAVPVPGVPFLNSFSDLIAGHYISSMCRLTNAMILTACLSIGFLGGLAVMNLSMFKLI